MGGPFFCGRVKKRSPLIPYAVAAAALIGGWSLACAGVYMLAGPAWALICAAVPPTALGLILFRGLTNASNEAE